MSGIAFTVPGPPVAKGRARNGNGHHYTPAKTVNAEAAVAAHARQAMSRAGLEPMDGELTLSFLALMPIPDSWPKNKKAQASSGRLMALSKPDLDNLLKLLKDGMNKITYTDDARIVHLGDCLKGYSVNPRLHVRVAPFCAADTGWLMGDYFDL